MALVVTTRLLLLSELMIKECSFLGCGRADVREWPQHLRWERFWLWWWASGGGPGSPKHQLICGSGGGLPLSWWPSSASCDRHPTLPECSALWCYDSRSSGVTSSHTQHWPGEAPHTHSPFGRKWPGQPSHHLKMTHDSIYLTHSLICCLEVVLMRDFQNTSDLRSSNQKAVVIMPLPK